MQTFLPFSTNQDLLRVDASIVRDAQRLAKSWSPSEISRFLTPSMWDINPRMEGAPLSTSKSGQAPLHGTLPTYTDPDPLFDGQGLFAQGAATPASASPTFLDASFVPLCTRPASKKYNFYEFMNERCVLMSFLSKLGGVFIEKDLLRADWLLTMPSDSSEEYMDVKSILTGQRSKWQWINHSYSMEPNVKAVLVKGGRGHGVAGIIKFQVIAPIKEGDQIIMEHGCLDPEWSYPDPIAPRAKKDYSPPVSKRMKTSTPPPHRPLTAPNHHNSKWPQGWEQCLHEGCTLPVCTSDLGRGHKLCDFCFGDPRNNNECIQLGGGCAPQTETEDEDSEPMDEDSEVELRFNDGPSQPSPTPTPPRGLDEEDSAPAKPVELPTDEGDYWRAMVEEDRQALVTRELSELEVLPPPARPPTLPRSRGGLMLFGKRLSLKPK